MVQSANGIVTLNGQVPNDAARALAAREAAGTPGVRQVINNITVAPVSAAAPAQQPAEQTPSPVMASRHRAHREEASAAARVQEPPEEPPVSTPPAATPAAAPPAEPPPVNPAPQVASAPAEAEPPAPLPPPPTPQKYTVPADTVISVRLIDALDSTQNKAGDIFHATLRSPISVDDQIVVPAGADVEGRVVESENAGRFSGHAALKLELTRLTSHGHSYPLYTADFDRTTANRGKGSAETVGAGAAIGAIIGAIAGGGKGAGIGTLAGAGAGAAGRAARKGKGIHLPSETVLSFRLQSPLTVTILPGENAPQRE